jgi:hypothetical protein
MKTAHLRRWLGRSALRRTTAYASVVASSPPSIWTVFIDLLLRRPDPRRLLARKEN